MQKITPFLWFDSQAEEAATFYTSLFENSSIGEISRYGEGGPAPAGTAMVVPFELAGQKFLALNGGPMFSFTPAISFMVDCSSQEEVDHYWNAFLDGGEAQSCGWIRDRYGVSWQVIPAALPELMQAGNAEQSGRVMQAMMKMQKIEIALLQAAFDGV